MNCQIIQEYLLTDYIDNRMDACPQADIEQHLIYCRLCREYLVKLSKQVKVPLTNVRHVNPEPFLWDLIKQRIEDDRELWFQKSLIPDFWQSLRLSLQVPRPAFAIVTIVTIIWMIGTTGQIFINNILVKVNGAEQVEYISSLIDDSVGIPANNGNGSETPIEQYFL